MKSLLSDFVVFYRAYDDFQQKVDQYQHAIESKEWSFFREHLLVIKSRMANNLLSKKFTELSATEKDIIQKTYYNINQIIDYLDNPVKWFKHRNKLQQVLPNLKSKVKPS
jgi:hypothetical protein